MEGFEASNVTHQMKKLDIDHLKKFRDTLKLPISDDRLSEAPYYHPGKDSDEVKYMLERRHALGGSMPHRKPKAISLPSHSQRPSRSLMRAVKLASRSLPRWLTYDCLRNLLRDKGIGKSSRADYSGRRANLWYGCSFSRHRNLCGTRSEIRAGRRPTFFSIIERVKPVRS